MVTKVSVSYGGTFVSISGPQGVSVMEMPLRWGIDGMYQDGKSNITCQTFNIHEHSLDHLECVQTRWHPNSPKDSHLLVLLSDNSIRMYDESSLKSVWRVGPLPNYSAVEKNLSYLQSLGDTAVDFEIAPAKIRQDFPFNDILESNIDDISHDLTSMSLNSKKNHLARQKKIEWPIVILRGNGTVYVMNAGLNSEQPRLQGPLTVKPPSTVNYGDDYCSLLVIPTLPHTIVVAENSGILHHLLMMETSNEDLTLDETKTIIKNDWDLYVLESIELELGLSEDQTTDTPIAPLTLKKDPVNEQRYFCYHQTGLHGVTIGFVQQLQSYLNNETVMEPNMNVSSRAEYILSTKAFNSSMVNAVVGVGLLQSPSGMFAVLSSGQVVSMNTIKLSLSIIPDSSVSQFPACDQKTDNRKIPFDHHIKALLSSGVKQPILKVDKTNPPTSKQALELLMNAVQVMRDNQFKRHDLVRQEIAKRMKILEFMKKQQKEEIAQLFEDKELIQEKAYKLADKHEDIMESQQNLHKRVQDVLRITSLRVPTARSNEKEFSEQVRKIKQSVAKLLQDVKQIKAKNEIQKNQFDSLDNVNSESTKVLPPKQEETIKGILIDMAKQVANLTSDVKKISSIIDV